MVVMQEYSKKMDESPAIDSVYKKLMILLIQKLQSNESAS